MTRRLSTLGLLFLVAACGDGAPEGQPAPADTAAADTAGTADSVRIVLVTGALRLEPAAGAAAVTEVAAGTVLRIVGDTGIGRRRWVRLATWDDRMGWMSEREVLDAGLWSHYAGTLGGIAPVALRPAYPVGDGRWAAERPFPSPDLDPPGDVWLAGDSLVSTATVERDTMTVECTGERHSLAILERGARATSGRGVRLEDGVLAIPASREPTARPLLVGPLDPDAGLREAVADAARAALETGPPDEPPADTDAPPPPAPATPPLLDWRAVGQDAAWAVAYWNPFEGREAEIMPGRWGVAFLALRDETGWAVRTVLPLGWSSVGPDAPPWRLLAAVATVPGRPTLLAIEVLGYEGARIDLHLADDAGFRRFYRGFYWGC